VRPSAQFILSDAAGGVEGLGTNESFEVRAAQNTASKYHFEAIRFSVPGCASA
jgi:hypothetical protein